MNRRSFLKRLGAGALAGAVAPAAIVAAKASLPGCCTCAGRSFWEGPCEYCTRKYGHLDARLGEWNNYYSESSPDIQKAIDEYNEYGNFSAFARNEAIDEMVAKAAEELGKAAAEEINRKAASHTFFYFGGRNV